MMEVHTRGELEDLRRRSLSVVTMVCQNANRHVARVLQSRTNVHAKLLYDEMKELWDLAQSAVKALDEITHVSYSPQDEVRVTCVCFYLPLCLALTRATLLVRTAALHPRRGAEARH